ncbi:hypothetical protein VCSRO163_3607 [Vibrio cholerae]|uniref:type I restriction enzyme HsdR N-terminal domain-containing protein n=1 Tax=Vibrio TaxID=662 RepID=UPI001559C200|nr:type I restriction enzyme HsdR N-terminal domain-containing protein [Vibrio fluvialis]ELI1809230.1 type I restriction enzyme HsdR N-terminal domain-containing protein [Vibrio fluvialis]GHY17667.1 hypothetical protein VCSRO163_3607 [Vibrio cholerae]
MEQTEDQIITGLSYKLLDLGYPKESIIRELAIRNAHGSIYHIDLAIIDQETNKLLAIFEVKKGLKSNARLRASYQQILSYAENVSGNVLLFLYSADDEEERVYSIDGKSKKIEPISELPPYESLRSSSITSHNEVEHKLKSNVVSRWGSTIAAVSSSAVIGILASMVLGLLSDSSPTMSNKDLTLALDEIQQSQLQLRESLSELKQNLIKVESGVSTLSNLPDEQVWKIEVSKLKGNTDIITAKIDALEDALTVNPAKALAVPILRKDLENVEQSLKAELRQTRAELDRMYDQNKWFIGLLFTVALSVLGIVATNWAGRKDT